MIDYKERKLKTNVKELRNHNMVPGVLYGSAIDSTPIKMKFNELEKYLDQKGEIYKIKTPKGTTFAKFEEVQFDPVHSKPVHFSLVTLKKGEKTVVDIPLVMKGNSPGEKYGGTIINVMDSIKVEAVPSKMPEQIEFDVNELDIGDTVLVSDLKLEKSFDIEEPDNTVVAVCSPPTVMETKDDEPSFAIEQSS